ncbi:30 kDa heat shock protein [Penicillium canariense]|uniref:30 kDa heat shock protein n=1 Tax=Penicillium canariense TaxID=189055 RepID=A0A9W9HU58_9EURO|nr:30 kDa heat shock protein [Penicillium canariense]KAJ5157546.1 30 kDa heat shock protein [Penicillium canariense]
MAFLSCSDFSPLFRLLDDYETHRSRPAPSTARSPSTRTTSAPTRRSFFTPAFDVRELNEAYYLDGELPGVDQSNIDIEFSDPQTLVIKGRTERNYQSQSSPAEAQVTPSSSRATSPQWRQPTVEDENEDEDTDVSDARSTSTAASTTSTAAVMVQKPSAAPPSAGHYWAAERSIGEFQRTFSFPARVNQDGVRASLKNGILSVIVPKEAAPKTKKIRIY